MTRPVERWSAAVPTDLTWLATPATDLEWCGRLERATPDVTVGKVLCVCAAAAVARFVLTGNPHSALGAATDALALLNDWIDDPTDGRFERICSIIFAVGEAPAL